MVNSGWRVACMLFTVSARPMKNVLHLLAAITLFTTAAPVRADDDFGVPAGTRLKLQTSQPLPDEPAEVTFVRSKGEWVLVEYDRTYTVRGESGSKTEKVQLWVNSKHVISVRVLGGK